MQSSNKDQSPELPSPTAYTWLAGLAATGTLVLLIQLPVDPRSLIVPAVCGLLAFGTHWLSARRGQDWSMLGIFVWMVACDFNKAFFPKDFLQAHYLSISLLFLSVFVLALSLMRIFFRRSLLPSTQHGSIAK